jgi:hypothetical protein
MTDPSLHPADEKYKASVPGRGARPVCAKSNTCERAQGREVPDSEFVTDRAADRFQRTVAVMRTALLRAPKIIAYLEIECTKSAQPYSKTRINPLTAHISNGDYRPAPGTLRLRRAWPEDTAGLGATYALFGAQ